MAALSSTLGEIIRRHRVVAGWSQEKLAERADLHRTHIGFIERGQRSPTVDVLERISAALGVRASELMRQAEDCEPEGEADIAE